MRKLRELQPAPVDDAVGKPARLWTKREGIVFALGLFAVFIGLGLAGYFQIGRLGLSTEEARYDNLEEALQRIDQMDVSQLWDTWLGVREIGIGPYSPPQFVVNRHVASRWLIIIWVGLIIACLGIVTCIAAFVMRRSSKPESQPR